MRMSARWWCSKARASAHLRTVQVNSPQPPRCCHRTAAVALYPFAALRAATTAADAATGRRHRPITLPPPPQHPCCCNRAAAVALCTAATLRTAATAADAATAATPPPSFVQWGFLEDSGEFVHLQRNCLPPKKGKRSKINRIEIWIYFHAKNKSIGEDLFLDPKSKIDFSLLNIQNIAY